MNYFRARRSLKRILELSNLYVGFVKAQQDADLQTAWKLQQEMAHLSTAVQRDLRTIGTGHFVLRDAPALGGREQVVDLASLAYQPALRERYHIEDPDMVLQFQATIGECERLRSSALWNLFNPFWWIRELLAYVLSLPFYLIGLAGFNQEAIESSLGGRVFKLLSGLVVVGAALVTIIQFLLDRGWLSFLLTP